MYEIEKNIPLPTSRKGVVHVGGFASKFPIREMVIGDSFFIPFTKVVCSKQGLRGQIGNMARGFGKKTAIRTMESNGADGFRVWRIE